jgi:hypothetical protein
MKFENGGSQKSGRSIFIDFQIMNIHTGTYVIGATGRAMDFHIIGRVLDLS